MEQVSLYISLIFGATTLLTLAIFYKATRYSKTVLFVLAAWMALQAFVALTGFYTKTTGLPPRFVLLVLPPLAGIVALFLTPAGKHFLDGLDLRMLMLIHAVRIPVELVLFWLFVHKVVPQVMTFEGRNVDILAGLTAPLFFYFGFVKKRISRRGFLLWNVLCLASLVNIVVIAILSAPFPFQKFGFLQPNIALLYFPFIWLPGCIVPLVLFAHLASIRQLLLKTKTTIINKGSAKETGHPSVVAVR